MVVLLQELFTCAIRTYTSGKWLVSCLAFFFFEEKKNCLEFFSLISF